MGMLPCGSFSSRSDDSECRKSCAVLGSEYKKVKLDLKLIGSHIIMDTRDVVIWMHTDMHLPVSNPGDKHFCDIMGLRHIFFGITLHLLTASTINMIIL